MKISPLAQGSGVPAGLETNPTRTVSLDRVQRAKAVFSGQELPEEPSTGDLQADKVRDSVRRIKMRTQVSTNRHNVEQVDEVPLETSPEIPTTDTIEPIAQEPEETKPLSPQFAALAKAKRALQVKERELAQREEALKTSSQNFPSGSEDLIAKLKANPLGVLLENGVSYDQLTESIIASQNGVNPEVQALKAELKALKEDLTGQFSTRDQQAEQQILAEIKKEAMMLANTGDQFEAIREAKAYEDVKNLVHRVWKEGWPDKGYEAGHVLDTAEAAEYVENQLIEESLRFAKLKKVQSRLTPAQEAQVAAQIPTPKPGTKIMRTLTNRDTASPTMDKRARAIAAMNGTLKKG